MYVTIREEGFMVASFDYKNFAKDLKKQAEQVIPDDIASEHKKEFLDRIYDFTANKRDIGFVSSVTMEEGIRRCVEYNKEKGLF